MVIVGVVKVDVVVLIVSAGPATMEGGELDVLGRWLSIRFRTVEAVAKLTAWMPARVLKCTAHDEQ